MVTKPDLSRLLAPRAQSDARLMLTRINLILVIGLCFWVPYGLQFAFRDLPASASVNLGTAVLAVLTLFVARGLSTVQHARILGAFVLAVGWCSLVAVCIVAGQSQGSAQAYLTCFPIAVATLMGYRAGMAATAAALAGLAVVWMSEDYVGYEYLPTATMRWVDHAGAIVLIGLFAVVLRRTADQERLRLEYERQAAQAAYTSQERFLATMSHEVRTPLTAILGTTRVLLQGQLEEAQRQRLRTIRRSGRSLMSLLDSSLDFAALREGRIVLEPLPTDIDATLQSVVELFRGRAEERGLTLELVGEPVGWRLLDGHRLQQILANLVANAVKFTTTGGVVVRVLRDSPLMISVEDTGPGVQDLEAIFQPFHQTDLGRRHGGTGLGLSIALGLAHAMGGKLVVHSEPGQGSRFTLTLSAPVAEPVDERSELHGVLASQLPSRVLVVEDNDVNRRVALEMLRVLGYDARAAASGDEAMRLVSEEPADVVFMDLNMPGQDGLSVTRRLLQTDPDVWVVALTANVQEADRLRCREAGMRDFVPKPFELSSLADAITRWGARRA